MELLDKPWTYSKEDILKAFKVSSDKGLNASEAGDRPNRIPC
jgi:hypothetical protein